MRITHTPDFITPSNATYRSLRHFPRTATGQGLNHTTVITIAVSASVGGVLVAILCWRIFSRLSGRSRSVPLPPRQALVHQREHRLAAFSEHKNASIPLTSPDVRSSVPTYRGSNASLIPHANDSPANTSSVHAYETDEDIQDNPPSPHGPPLYPPTPPYVTPHLPTSASSTSLLSSNDRSSLYSAATTPATTFSTSTSPNQSLRRPKARHEPRPFSMTSDGTSRTSITPRSRSSVRGAPHAPHSNLKIVLPAPLAPELYSRAAGENKGQRTVVRDDAYRDSWRDSLVDKWIPVGQHAMPEPKSEKRQSRHDSMEGPSQLTGRMYAAASITSVLNFVFIGDPSRSLPRQRSTSNPAPLSRLRQASGPSQIYLPSGTHLPVPHIPSEFGTPPKQKGRMPSVPTGTERH